LISKKFIALAEHYPYKLRYSINEAVDGDVLKPLITDEQFKDAIDQAIYMKSSLRIFIQISPGIFPPLDATNMDGIDDNKGSVDALKEMYSSLIDPADTDSYTMLSFYGFDKIDDSEGYSMMLKKLWSPFKALGRVSYDYHHHQQHLYHHLDHHHHLYHQQYDSHYHNNYHQHLHHNLTGLHR